MGASARGLFGSFRACGSCHEHAGCLSAVIAAGAALGVSRGCAGCSAAGGRAPRDHAAGRTLGGCAGRCVRLQSPLLLRLRLLGCPSWGLQLPMHLRLLPLGPYKGHKSGATAPLALPVDGHKICSSPSASSCLAGLLLVQARFDAGVGVSVASVCNSFCRCQRNGDRGGDPAVPAAATWAI